MSYITRTEWQRSLALTSQASIATSFREKRAEADQKRGKVAITRGTNAPAPLPPVPLGAQRFWYVCADHNSQAYWDRDADASGPCAPIMPCGCELTACHINVSEEPSPDHESRTYDFYADLSHGIGAMPAFDDADPFDYYRDRLIPHASIAGDDV